MLYDEEGRPFIERPLLPEDFNTFWIVKDYRRMYDTYAKMERKIQKQSETIQRMAQHDFCLHTKLKELFNVTGKIVKQLKRQDKDISKEDYTTILDAYHTIFPNMKSLKPYSFEK